MDSKHPSRAKTSVNKRFHWIVMSFPCNAFHWWSSKPTQQNIHALLPKWAGNDDFETVWSENRGWLKIGCWHGLCVCNVYDFLPDISNLWLLVIIESCVDCMELGNQQVCFPDNIAFQNQPNNWCIILKKGATVSLIPKLSQIGCGWHFLTCRVGCILPSKYVGVWYRFS